MKILIVDDNANNRMVLKLLVEEYGENKNTIYEIDECANGLEAVNKSKRTAYNMIFMDIMMPEMDGIEATKKIRARNMDVMIIAVSAVDDELRQKEILRNGAEDYISKPLDAKVLNSRLDNYFSLLKLRHHGRLSEHRKSANLYTKDIFFRQTIFYVTTEEALAEFWEFYLLDEVSKKIDGLSDVIRVVFNIGEAIVKLETDPWIIVEEDNESMFFTINRIDVIGSLVIKLVMKKNDKVKEFKVDHEKMSFKLLKESKVMDEVKEEVPLKIEPKEKKNSTQIEIAKTNVDTYLVFEYMDRDDLAETEEYLGELTSIMLMLGSTEIDPKEVSSLDHYLQKLGQGLTTYGESYVIGESLISLSESISKNSERFGEISEDLSTLSSAFVSDLQSWLRMTFYEGAPSVDFMDATISANTQTIAAMLVVDDGQNKEVDMDDVFDF